MSGITSAIEALVTSTFNKVFVLRINKTKWILLAFCALCVSAGLFFLALALYEYLEDLYAPYIAALISSALVFTAAIAAILLNMFLQRKNTSHYRSAQDELSEHIRVLIKEICNELEGPIIENPKTSVLIAALAGLVAARRI
jgi:hypothetical protein